MTMLIAHEQSREVYQTKHNSRAILITMINLFLIIVKMYTRYIYIDGVLSIQKLREGGQGRGWAGGTRGGEKERRNLNATS